MVDRTHQRDSPAMEPVPQAPASVEFGRFRILPRRREVLVDGWPIELGGRAFDVLLTLIEANGAVVEKDDLVNRVWPGRIIEEDNLRAQIRAIHIALADRGLIRTVAGRGYQRTAELRSQDGPPEQRAATGVAPRLSIVVLPFITLSDDREQQYFADGITEDLTTDLSRLAGYSIISRNTAFTYRDRPPDTKQIGRELGARYVLEGSVQRSGNRVRVSAQLIDAETDTHLWADRLDSDNDFSGSPQPTLTSSQRNTSGRAGWKRLGPFVTNAVAIARTARPMRLRRRGTDGLSTHRWGTGFELLVRGRAKLIVGRPPQRN